MSKFRVWHNINGSNFQKEVSSVEEAKVILMILAEYDGFLAEKFQVVEFNACGLEEQDETDGEWYEWYSEDGRDMSEILFDDED